MTLFELVAKITADSTEFDSAVGKAEKSGKNLKDSLSANMGKIKTAIVGALSVAAIKRGIDKVIDLANAVSVAGDRIDKQSQVLGLSRKAYQEWDYILGQNGASIDSMNVSMKTLNSTILSAKDGNKEAKDSFAQLGVGIHELENLSVEDQFEAVVRAFQRMPAGANKSALAVKLFGRQGMELLPLLNQSETSIDELRQRAQELGLIMSDDAVDASVVYGDSLDDLNRTLTGFKNAIGAKVLPVLTKGIQSLTNYAGKLSKAYQDKGLSGVWDTLVSDFLNIKWPSWSDVATAITNGWNTIVEGVKKLPALVFGTDEVGNVKWPDVNKLLADFKTWWENTARPALEGAIVWTLQLFGMPTETAEGIASILGEWWSHIVDTAQKAIKWVLSLPSMPPHEAGQQLGNMIREWWRGVRESAEKLLKWTLGLFGIGDENGTDTKAMIGTWWDEKVVPLLKGALNFVLGLFDLPDFDTMVAKIQAWWESVKAGVGNLVLNIIPNIFSGPQNSNNDPMGVFQGGSHGFGSDIPGFVSLPGHASGMWNVPKDDYLARLHRGEMVLNASRARDYRQGSQGIDMTQLVSGVVGAIRQGMDGAEVNSYLDGKGVSGNVNRRTLNQIKARRFAT